MKPDDLKKRTKAFGISLIRLVEKLPQTRSNNLIGNQLLRAGMSVGANYRAGCRARSRADFIAKMKIVEEECDETLYWLELLQETGQTSDPALETLRGEGCEILSIMVASIKTARLHT